MNFFHHKDLGNHLLQLCPKVVKHPYDIIVTLPSTPLVLTFVVAVCSVLLPESCVFPYPVFSACFIVLMCHDFHRVGSVLSSNEDVIQIKKMCTVGHNTTMPHQHCVTSHGSSEPTLGTFITKV